MREISLALVQKAEICGASLPDPLGLQLAPCRATVRPERNGRLLSKYCVRLAPKPSLVPLLLPSSPASNTELDFKTRETASVASRRKGCG